MATTFDIIEYLAGLTAFVLDETILQRIALDRGVSEVTSYAELTQKDKDLCLADILYMVYVGPSDIPSFQHQHGQFSTSTGKQTLKDKDSIYATMVGLYKKWGDERLALIPETSLNWMF